MIKNYFKTTLRKLWNTRGYSFLNIFGLAVGIAAASFIFLWVEDEISYDEFPNKGNIYLTKSKQTLNGVSNVFDAVPGPLGPAVKDEISGIKHAARVSWNFSHLFAVGENSIYQKGYFAERDFIDIFSLQFVEGDKATAMDKPNDLVITQSTAKRLFGKEPALGKIVRRNNQESHVVSGVVRDLPKNSTFQFDWLIPFEAYESQNQYMISQWRNNVLMTFVQLEPLADVNAINKQLHDFVRNKSEDGQINTHNFLYPMGRWRLWNSFDSDGNEQEGRMKYVRLFSIIAWVVLVIACINFINLSTARSEKRAKEVGMRKVVGASRTSLIGRFLGEAFMMVILSSLLAIGCIYLLLGAFNGLVEKELVVAPFKLPHVSFMAGIILLCGLTAGSYPAFYLSSFNPIATLKGARQKEGATGSIRRGLVVLQYTASVTLIVCTVIVFQQISHIKGRDRGFESSQMLLTPIRGNVLEHVDAIKQQLMATGEVEGVALSNSRVLTTNQSTWSMSWQGKDPNKDVTVGVLQADADFIPTLSMQLTDGRNFRDKQLGDSNSIIVNEAFAKLIKPDGKVAGQSVYWDDMNYTIIGVVEDFTFNNIYAPAEPISLHPLSWSTGFVNIKIKAGVDLSEAVSHIEKVMKTNNPDYPFEYDFLDTLFDNKFKSEMLVQKLAGVFAVLSVIISCLGLFGLAAFTAERRTKELGIRKVLGASMSSLVGLLNREFVALVLISCAIAFPIAWWIMSDWLKGYQYHTELHWWVFGLAGLGALLIALFTVSSQAIKAALANPVESLRDE